MRVENEVSGEFRHRGDGSTPKRFPLAAQPEIMRAAEKDDQYASYVYDACRDAFRHLFGTRYAVAYQSETKLLGQMLYYILTTGSGQQTLGEEYCDITQVASPYGLPPTPARRALFIVYQTAVPYLAERISSRMAARGVILADSQPEEFHGSSDPGRNQIQSSRSENSSSSSTGLSMSALSRLKEKFHRLWLWAVQKWPSVLPYAREILQLVLRANLMFFYFEGLYYHISKRAAGIRYVFIGKPLNQRPRYQILGVFLLIQLCILGAEGLRRSNLSSIASSVHQTSLGAHQASGGRGLPILNEDGNLITDSNLHKGKGNWTSVVTGSEACEFLPDASFGIQNGSQIAKEEAHASKTPLEHNVILQLSCIVCFSPNLSVSANALSASVVVNTQQQHPVVTSSVGTASWSGAMKNRNALSAEHQ